MSDELITTARAELLGALEALEELAALVAEDEGTYRSSIERRQRFRYVWVVAGSRLKNYCQVMGIARAIGQLGGAIGFRNTLAYARPSRVDDDIVWPTSLEDLPKLREAVREAERAIAQDDRPPPSPTAI